MVCKQNEKALLLTYNLFYHIFFLSHMWTPSPSTLLDYILHELWYMTFVLHDKLISCSSLCRFGSNSHCNCESQKLTRPAVWMMRWFLRGESWCGNPKYPFFHRQRCHRFLAICFTNCFYCKLRNKTIRSSHKNTGQFSTAKTTFKARAETPHGLKPFPGQQLESQSLQDRVAWWALPSCQGAAAITGSS